ncbi:MAG TPA: PKD domain-containing protein, partial [Rugosimonospora sp.]|nr:PKD domain-containing protein [Rugosimonospora sp.]
YSVTASGLVAIDVATGTGIPIPSAPGVQAMVAGADGRRMYATTSSGTVLVIDTTASHVAGTIPVGANPQGIQLAPDGQHLYVENRDGNSISVIDTATNTVTRTFSGIPEPTSAVVSPDGAHLYVSLAGTTQGITVVDTATGAASAVTPLDTATSYLAISPDGAHVYVASPTTGTVSSFDTATGTLTTLFTVAQRAWGLTISPDGQRLYALGVNELYVADAATGTVSRTVQASGLNGQMSVSPDGGTLYVPAPNNDYIVVYDTATFAEKDQLGGNTPYSAVLVAVPEIAAPAAHLTLSADAGSGLVTADATGSTGFALTGYRFDFGDGTVLDQTSSTGFHEYPTGGTHTVTVTVTDLLGRTAKASATITIPVAQRRAALLGNDMRFVTAENAGAQPLVANRTADGPWEYFDFVGVDSDHVALLALANGEYVRVDPTDGRRLIADRTDYAGATIFRLVPGPNGALSLQDTGSGLYVSDNNGTAPVTADRSVIGPWEQFHTTVSGAADSFRSSANGKYVTAESAGAKSLIANRTSVGQWESFDAIDAGGGYLAWYSEADGKYVTAESAGAKALIANRTSIGDWEKFTLVHNDDGSVSLLANANGRYVTAESAGTQPLIANRTAIGTWEEFNAPT